ncbi:MAG: DMT family transporter, partial [Pseudomonadota bacterium]
EDHVMAFLTVYPPAIAQNDHLRGIGFGLIAASAWSVYTVASRSAVEAGFSALDLTALRYVVAALVFLPFMLNRGIKDLGGIGWHRGALLALGAGPLFSLFYVYGMSVTPYAHGPVVSPSMVTLASIMLAALVLRETVSVRRAIASVVVLAGLYLVVSNGSNLLIEASPFDLFFVASGVLWAVFTVLLRKWQLDPVLATASVAMISGLVMLPVLLVTADWTHLLDNVLLTGFHAIVQGVVAAGIAVVAFSKAVVLLGASKAGLFPSLVPVIAVILGVPLLDEVPTAVQTVGVALASIGLIMATISK